MSRIPFIHAQFPDSSESEKQLMFRLEKHLRKLRAAKPIPQDPEDDNFPESLKPYVQADTKDAGQVITYADNRRIERRAQRLYKARLAASGLGHLKKEDRQRLEALRNGVSLVTIPSEHRADELAAELHSEMPWMSPATELIWHAMRASVREGWPGLRLPSMLLDGPPGIGKSHFARRLGSLLSLPTTIVEATSESASFGLVGGQKGWSEAHPGRVLDTVLHSLVGNPIIIVDEIEKAGDVTSHRGQAFRLVDALLPLLEPMTARKWTCPYFQVGFDMGWIGWILTSNDYSRLPEPLLSRCPPIRLRDLTIPELAGFLRRQGASRNLSEDAVEAMIDVLKHPGLRDQRPSLRVAARMLARAADLERMPMLH
ncbi:AAA family ATPase [Gemmobacter nectariphilus]|uniref:AAA family ATPase n=1 Tax=Gemmobacter nectariphilus TaxID=220343 RepID=UPI000489B4E0|nr:AAA family ATPase [Gemmobacter nectariphilus]